MAERALYGQVAAQLLGAPLHSKLIPRDKGCCQHLSRTLRFRARGRVTTLVRLVIEENGDLEHEAK